MDLTFIHQRTRQRPHKKSRKGCRVCKERKIKCDETRPVCGQCFKRFPNPEIECHFDIISHTSISHLSPNASQYTSDASDVEGSPAPPPMEAMLFQHFQTVTALQMPPNPSQTGIAIWTTKIPSMALEYPFLYNALLGIAALHKLSLNPESSPLREATYQFVDNTIAGHRNDICQLNAGNAEALLVTSYLLSLHANLRSIYLSPDVGYVPPGTAFRLQRGTRELILATFSLIGSSEFYRHFANSSTLTQEQNISCPRLPIPEDTSFLSLLQYSHISPQRKEVYISTLSLLQPIIHALRTGTQHLEWVRQKLLTFPEEISSEISGLMEESDPFALAVVARYYALMGCVEGEWWLNGRAGYEVRGLASLVPGGCEEVMEWPLGVLEMVDC